jgi:hypothetical protein
VPFPVWLVMKWHEVRAFPPSRSALDGKDNSVDAMV